ncbi:MULTISPECIES: site-specific integrase [unclassified Streptomyces]|uniref:tyrosine-type recombinase/integrase n=1 Tax=unclassified Streptomyces TaxID=2593676 RepID=UPI000DC7BC30|nr:MULTISPECIES: site-specific integrase [unclassified Streptomyces]AWZ03537.1 site-specific integrase [Streptomyces sp. ICC4]AWZ12604.1 site-specific integrase [Streptomyces sp. ICC1]
MKTTDVLIWGVRVKSRQGKDTYEVRWRVGDRPISRSRRTKGLADKLRAQLLMAQEAGEQFDTDTGLPSSMEEKAPARTWYDFALDYLRMKWPHCSPNYRDEINEALTGVTKALMPKKPGRPSDVAMQRALRDWAFILPGPDERDVPPEILVVLEWISKNSPPLEDLSKPAVTRGVLDALTLKLDGEAAAGETIKRKRKVFVNALNYAAELGEFAENPIKSVSWQKPPRIIQVDPRVVANPRQAGNLLGAVSYVGGYGRARGRRLVGLFAGMYYAGLRPAEAVGVALPDCTLPSEGWGEAVLHRTRPTVGKKWTRSGEVHDDRGLKNRDPADVRRAPLPPALVAIWRDSIDTFGTADDGRLFFNERGGLVGSSTYSRVWGEARGLGLPPELVNSPLADVPYDLRHSALSTWLNAGLDPTEVAERAGNSVEVLLARYAKCLHGRHVVANQRIDDLLREYE